MISLPDELPAEPSAAATAFAVVVVIGIVLLSFVIAVFCLAAVLRWLIENDDGESLVRIFADQWRWLRKRRIW